MLKNITLSTEELLIKKAREKALREHTTLNQLFRQWLRCYLGFSEKITEYRQYQARHQAVNAGRKFNRVEMHER